MSAVLVDGVLVATAILGGVGITITTKYALSSSWKSRISRTTRIVVVPRRKTKMCLVTSFEEIIRIVRINFLDLFVLFLDFLAGASDGGEAGTECAAVVVHLSHPCDPVGEPSSSA